MINYASKLAIAVIGLTFGFTIIFTIVINRQCHNVSNLLVCNTCIAATIHLILAVIASIAGVGKTWAWDAPYCIARGYIFVAVIGTFCYSYSIQALSRMFFAIFHKYKHLLHWRTHFIMIIFNWFIGFLVPTLPLIFIHGSFGLEIESRGCVLTSKSFSAAIFCAVVSFSVPLSLVIVVYGIIFYNVYQSTRRVMPFISNNNMTSTRSNAKRELKIVQQLVIQAGCLSCGGIFYLTNILWHKLSDIPLPKPMYLIGFSFMTNMISLMTVFQFFMNRNVKEIVVQRMCGRFLVRKNHRTDHTMFYTQRIMPRLNETIIV
ncbi:unnamed protein product [Rotaria sp. Silwood1]|nr:unnamed protein product [Rotaria sp. Silwood1]CAF1067443.1 unnamed protein product [Rotaria sp. Silwood1]CAF3400114.1 unnamed protein product [Rotaria sp. Silwood1]CAF4836864.1 unnamed protein product [Rotaria sp. Silwood1]